VSSQARRFTATLRRVSERLDIPQPARSRVLLEIAGDLDDLHAHYLASGLEAATAARRVEEEFALSDDALRALVALHASPLRRLLDGLSTQARGRWERGLLLGLLAFAALAAGRLVLTRDFFAQPSPFLWPVLLLALVALALSVAKAWLLFARQEHEPRRLRRHLVALPALAAGQLALGGLGAWLGLGLAAWRGHLAPEQVGVLMADALRSGVALMIVAQVCALLLALAWFSLERRIRAVEDHEALVLQEILAEGNDEGSE
jgi:hypothetical protein